MYICCTFWLHLVCYGLSKQSNPMYNYGLEEKYITLFFRPRHYITLQSKLLIWSFLLIVYHRCTSLCCNPGIFSH